MIEKKSEGKLAYALLIEVMIEIPDDKNYKE